MGFGASPFRRRWSNSRDWGKTRLDCLKDWRSDLLTGRLAVWSLSSSFFRLVWTDVYSAVNWAYGSCAAFGQAVSGRVVVVDVDVYHYCRFSTAAASNTGFVNAVNVRRGDSVTYANFSTDCESHY